MIEKVYLVGLTGPTGSGKSEVARVLTDWHIPVIDADELARQVVEPGSECLAKLVKEFSEDILQEDGSLNRRQLAKRAFATPADTKLLNDITHPYIISRTQKILMTLEQMLEPAAVIDAPLLFESGMDAICELTVAVVAPAQRRMERIMARDDLTAEQAQRRMAAQQDEEFYISRANEVLRNDGDVEQLRRDAADLARRIREWANG